MLILCECVLSHLDNSGADMGKNLDFLLFLDFLLIEMLSAENLA